MTKNQLPVFWSHVPSKCALCYYDTSIAVPQGTLALNMLLLLLLSLWSP